MADWVIIITDNGPNESKTLPGSYFKGIPVIVGKGLKKPDPAFYRDPGLDPVTHGRAKKQQGKITVADHPPDTLVADVLPALGNFIYGGEIGPGFKFRSGTGLRHGWTHEDEQQDDT
jgi:hypothetical protein